MASKRLQGHLRVNLWAPTDNLRTLSNRKLFMPRQGLQGPDLGPSRPVIGLLMSKHGVLELAWAYQGPLGPLGVTLECSQS